MKKILYNFQQSGINLKLGVITLLIVFTLINVHNTLSSGTFWENNNDYDSKTKTETTANSDEVEYAQELARVDSTNLRINDTIAASFSNLNAFYCPDSVTVVPITFTPPSPLPAGRVFVRISGPGVSSTGQYTADYIHRSRGKYQINYMVQDSLFEYQPIVRDKTNTIISGCDCNVYTGMSAEKIGYSTAIIQVGITDFLLPSTTCISNAAFNLDTLVDPLFSTGITDTQFRIITSTPSSYNPLVLSGVTFDPSLVTTTTTFTIEYDYVSPSGCSDTLTRTIKVLTPPAVPSFTAVTHGRTTPCEFTSINFSVNPVTDATSYAWTLPSGWLGSSTTNTVPAHTSNNAGNITVHAVNACGLSADTSLLITPHSIPAVPGSISGSITPCQYTASSYSISAVPGATSYVWTAPGDWSGTSATTNLSATTGKATGSISVSAVNACGSSSFSTLSVSTDSTPATPGSISGLNSLTQNTTNNPYSISAIANATGYNWSYSGTGATIHGSGASVDVDFSGTSTSGTLKVSATNACGTSTTSNYPIAISPSSVAQPANFTASTLQVCRGQSGLVYTIPNDPSVTYTWSYSGTGATINGSTNSVTIDFSSSSSSGQLSVTAQSGVTYSTPRTINIEVKSIPGTPDIITGSILPYVGIPNAYSVPAVTEATSYIWTLPAGWSGTSASNSITATPTITAGNITIAASNYCGTSSVSTLTGVVPGVKPATPGIISGLMSVNQGSSDHVYSISPVAGATSYVWTYVGAGATINGTGLSISIDFSENADSNGILKVTAVNAYGSSNASLMNIEVLVVTAVTKTGTALEEKLSFSVSPNPYMETAVVKVNAPNTNSITLTLTDLLGHTQNIVTDFEMEGYKEFDLPDLESGVYILSLYSKGAVYIAKVVRIK